MKVFYSALFCLASMQVTLSQSVDTSANQTHFSAELHQEHCEDCEDSQLMRCMDTPEQEAYVDSLHQVAMGKYVKPRSGSRMPPSVQGTLTWPLKPSDDFSEFSYYSIGNYVDLDTVIGATLDYSCGGRTYDNGTFNHDGTDISTYPYAYDKMANNLVEVVAAATGIITVRIDTNPDMNCVFSTRPSNPIKVAHADGTVAEYKLFKRLTATSKLVGDTVVQGEYLGVVGSSGSSTAPHLHFELRDSLNNVIDPFFGPCSANSDLPNITTATWWANQKPYVDSTINALITHAGMPVFDGCDPVANAGIPGDRRAKKYFEPGDSIVFGSYYRSVRDVHVASVTIYRPDNSVWMSWADDDAFNQNFYSTKAVLTPAELPNNAMEGEWRYVVVFEGVQYQVKFYVNACIAERTLFGNVTTGAFEHASQTITSYQTIAGNGASNAIYHSGETILLKAGFRSEKNSRFVARIAGCDVLPDD